MNYLGIKYTIEEHIERTKEEIEIKSDSSMLSSGRNIGFAL